MEPGLAEQERRRAERRERRGRPEARAQRRDSRRAFKRLRREEKVRLARQEFPEMFSTRDEHELPLMGGERVERYLGENVAVIESAEGERSLVDSTTALRAPEGGELAPVDFGLEAVGGGWEPVNGPVDVEFGERADRAFSLAGAFEAGIPGSSAVGERVANEVFFADVATDTDAWFGPAPTGARFAFGLRSEDAPEELRLQLDAGPDGELRVLAGSKAVEVLRGGEVVGRMGAPAAFDADGEPIDVSVRAEGTTVVFEVPHRGRDLLYPAILDPVTEDQSGWKYGANNYGGWRYYEQVPQFPHGYYAGLYIQRLAGYNWTRGQFAEWQYPAPTAGSAIYRTDFMYMAHASDFTNTTQGIWSTRLGRHQHQYTQGYTYNYSGTGTYWSACANGSTDPQLCTEAVNFYESNGNYAQASLWAGANGPRCCAAQMYLGGARVYLNDFNDPVPLYFQEPPAGWVHTVPAGPYNGPNEVHVRWGDQGLGMKRMWIEAPGMPTQYAPDIYCTGTQTSRCPADRWHNFSYASLPEGVRTVTYRAQDVLTRNGRIDRTLRIDRTPPAAPAASGSLPARAGDFVGPRAYTLGIQGSDNNSGVRSVSYRVVRDATGTQIASGAATNPNCYASGCSTTWKPADFNVDTTSWAPGRHTVEMTVKDQLGDDPAHGASHTRTTSFTVEMDPNPPTVSVSHEGLEPWLGDGREIKTTVTGTDQESGVKSFQLDFPTGPDETRTRGCFGTGASRCPTSDTETFTYRTDAARFPDEGRHQLRATVTDARGVATTSQPWQVNVDRTPPAMPDPTGGLWERRGQQLPEGTYELAVEASDGDPGGPAAAERSGVTTLEILIDGEIVDATAQDCAEGNCAASLDYVFETTAHPGGEHRVDVRAVDELGHESIRSFAFSTACCLGETRSWGAAPGLVDVAFGDVDADGLADLVTRDRLTGELEVGLSDGASFATGVSWGVWAGPGSPGRLQLSDVDGDGRADVVVRDAPSGGVYVARSSGSAFAAPVLWGGIPAGEEFAVADVNGDFSSDVVGRDPVTGAVRVGESAFFDGEGETRFGPPDVWLATGDQGLLVADADGDGTGDLVAREGSGTLRVTLSSTLDFAGESEWGSLASDHELAAGDVNGDGTADAVGRSPASGEVRFAASTTTAFEAAERVGSFPDRYSLNIADVNGDLREDLVGRDPLTGDVAVALSGAPGNFGPDAEEWVPDPEIPYDDQDLFADGPVASADGPVALSSGPQAQAAASPRERMQLGFEDPARLLYRNRLGVADPFGAGETAADDRLDVIYSRIRAAGARMVRFNVYWGTHQDSDGSFDFTRLGKAVDRARAPGNDMKVHVTLGGSADNECIGSGEDPKNELYNEDARTCEDDPGHDVCGARVDPTNPERERMLQKRSTGIAPDPDCFATFVRRAARYLGERVNVYSIWNEPNLRGFLQTPDDREKKVVPANLYRSLYVHGRDAVIAENSNAKVIIGELSYLRQGGRFTADGPGERDGVTAHEFLEQVARPGAPALETDGVAFHPYQHTAGPRKRGPKYQVGIGKGKQTQDVIDGLFDKEAKCSSRLFVRRDGGCKRPGLLYTEFGYLTRHPTDPKRVQKEARRARLFPPALRKALGDGAKWMDIYVATESPVDPPPARPPADYGVFGVDGSVRGARGDRQPRSAYCDGIRAFAIEKDYLMPDDPPAPC